MSMSHRRCAKVGDMAVIVAGTGAKPRGCCGKGGRLTMPFRCVALGAEVWTLLAADGANAAEGC